METPASRGNSIPFNRPLDLPLYENRPFVGDYRLNQSIQGAIRWGTLAPFAGLLLGLAMPRHEESYYPSYGLMGGFLIGIPAGATIGYFRGRTWERSEARGGDYQPRRMRLGYEVEAASGLAKGTDLGANSLALTYRPPGRSTWSPDEVHLFMGFNRWYTEPGTSTSLEASDDRFGIRGLKSLHDGVLSPYAGLSLGYAQGSINRPVQLTRPWVYTNHGGAFVDLLAGVKLNVFDLFHAKAQFTYEPYGPYFQLREEGSFSYLSNFNFGMSMGTYIF